MNSRSDFSKSEWNICAATGKTLFSSITNPLNLTFNNFELNHNLASGLACFINQPRLDKSLTEMIQKQEKNLALKTHLTVDIIEKIIPIDLHDFFVVLNIRVDPQDVNFISRILWEFVIKTYTCEKKDCCDKQKFCGPPGADDNARAFIIEQAFANGIRHIVGPRLFRAESIKTLDLDYKILLQSGGCHIIEDLTGLKRDAHSDFLWQKMLPKSFSKSVLEKFGSRWTYQEVEKSVAKYLNNYSIS